MQNDMTKGSPLRLIVFFTIPVLLGNIFQNVYNLMDSIIVGRFLGVNALAAVGATGTLTFLVFGWITGMTGGFGILLAQSFGAGDEKRLRHYTVMSLYLCVAMAVLMTAGLLLANRGILKLMNTPDTILDDTAGYIGIIYAGLPVTIAYNMLSSVSRSLGDSRTPLIFLIISSVLNIILDIVLITVIPLGVRGAAYATVIAQVVSAVACFFYVKKKYEILKIRKGEWGFSWASAGRLLMMGLPMGLQFSITAIGSMVMQSANNGLGSVCVSGFTAGMRIKQFTMCPFDAFATAASVFCSQNLGAGKADRIKQGLRQGIAVAVGYGAFAGLILIFAGRTLSMIFVSEDSVEVLDASAKYLRCMGYFYWTLGILNVCRMVTQGLGYSGRAVFSGVMEMLARTIVSLGFVGMFGFTAICFADQTAWVAASLYIAPTCLYCIRKSTKKLEAEKAMQQG